MPEGISADTAFILHDDEYHRDQSEAETEELKLGKHGGLHKKPAAPCINDSRKRRQAGIDVGRTPAGARSTPIVVSSDDNTGNLSVLPLAENSRRRRA